MNETSPHLKLLICDDELDNRYSWVERIRDLSLPIEIFQACDLFEAEAIIKTHHPQMMIADLMIPTGGYKGYQENRKGNVAAQFINEAVAAGINVATVTSWDQTDLNINAKRIRKNSQSVCRWVKLQSDNMLGNPLAKADIEHLENQERDIRWTEKQAAKLIDSYVKQTALQREGNDPFDDYYKRL